MKVYVVQDAFYTNDSECSCRADLFANYADALKFARHRVAEELWNYYRDCYRGEFDYKKGKDYWYINPQIDVRDTEIKITETEVK